MRPRSLCYLALLSTTACGSGRLVPAEAPEPSAPAPVAAPEPAAEPTPAVSPPSSAPTPDAAAPYQPYDASGSLPIRRIGQWTTSGISSPERKVIRDDSTYARFWEALGIGQRPAVDFSRDVSSRLRPGSGPRVATPSPSSGWHARAGR